MDKFDQEECLDLSMDLSIQPSINENQNKILENKKSDLKLGSDERQKENKKSGGSDELKTSWS